MKNNNFTELEKKLKEIDENLFIDRNEDGTFIRYDSDDCKPIAYFVYGLDNKKFYGPLPKLISRLRKPILKAVNEYNVQDDVVPEGNNSEHRMKVKIFREDDEPTDDFNVCTVPLEERINDFIEGKEVIDIKYRLGASECYDIERALIVYKE